MTANESSAKPEPPEEPLANTAAFSSAAWLVVAKNRRVKKDWEIILARYPENMRRCYQDLCTQPMQRYPGRVFPLKGKKYSGVWEYEVTGGARVFYIPDSALRKVVVYYAGEHIQPAPLP